MSELAIGGLSEDDELAALARQAGVGSPRAFEELARRVRRRIQAWAHRVTHDQDDADDVAQLVLLRLYARVSEYEGRSRFTTWLYRMTRNLAMDRRRLETRRRALLHAAGTPAEEPVGGSHDARSDRTQDFAHLVRSYFDQLPARQREVFNLSDVQGMDSTQIGAKLGISGSTVRVLLLRARRTIRLRILEQHPELLEEYRE